MRQGVDCDHSYLPVLHASGFRTVLALATAEDMLINHVDISQAFLQGNLLKDKGFEGDVFISPPPSAKYVYHLCAPLYGACTSSRTWHKTMSTLLEQQGFKTVGFEKSTWCRHNANGDKIMVGSHIDDFYICCTNRACLDEFRFALLDPAKDGFESTYEGPLHHYLGCAIVRDLDASTTSLLQAHYIERVCQKYGQWNVTQPKTPMMPDTCLTVDDCPEGYVDPHFHAQYRGIVGSLGWIMAMTRPDCSFVHASLSRFVQYPGPVHMQAALRVLAYLRGTIDHCLVFTRSGIASHENNHLWGWVDTVYTGC